MRAHTHTHTHAGTHRYKVATDANGARVFAIPKGDVALAKQALVSGGSLVAGFEVYADFMTYRGGTVYTKPSRGKGQGGHAVAVIGYGTLSGKPYWILANRSHQQRAHGPTRPAVMRNLDARQGHAFVLRACVRV